MGAAVPVPPHDVMVVRRARAVRRDRVVRRARHRGPVAGAGHRGQGGFALMAGLMVWFALAGAVLIALMGMTLGASRASTELARDAREARAVDAALETAITQIRMDPRGVVGSATPDGSGACERSVGTGAAPTGLTYADRDATTVVVTAECEEASRRVADPAEGEPRAARVDVVGDAYTSPAGLADTVPWSRDCRSPGDADCYPWRAAIGVANHASRSAEIAALRPTLLHTSDPAVAPADATLEVAADVTVARTALPLTNPPRDERAAGLAVAGAYRQGDPGPFSDVGGEAGCGLLGPAFPWLVPGGRVVDSDDPAGAPACAAPVLPATGGLDAPARWPQAGTERAVPACPAGAGAVATVQPGTYGAAATRALNDLLGGACPGRVLWFPPGDYWLDVDDPTNPAAERNALRIDDPTVRVVMGTPAGGATAAAAAAATFPEACDRRAAGVSLTLSPRTSLRHLRGRLSACDRAPAGAGATPPAVWQAGDADGGWRGTPDPARSTVTLGRDATWLSWGASTLAEPGGAWAMDGTEATATFDCFVLLLGGCGADVNLSAVGVGADTPAPSLAVGAARVRSLDLLLRASARSSAAFTASLVGGGQASTQVTLTRAGGTAPTCAVGFPSVPDPRAAADFRNTYSYDLFSPQAESVAGLPRCAEVRDGVGITRADLRGAQVDVRIRLYSWVTLFGVIGTVVDVDGLELRAGWDLVPASATGGTGWSDAANLLALDGRHTGFSLTCGGGAGACPSATRSVTASGLDNAAEPWVPTGGALVAAGVVVTGETTRQNFFTNGSYYDLDGAPDTSGGSWMRVTLDAADGTRLCQAQWPRIPFWGQGLYLDLLDAPGSCRARLRTADQLVGASATLEVFLQRNGPSAGATFGVRIDHLKVSTVSAGTYTGPTSPHVLTQGPAPATGSATVQGAWSTPRAPLNVDWSGPPPVRPDGTDVPVVGGQLVVGSVGSRVRAGGAAGVLCCAGTRPAERIVTLRAAVDAGGTRREAATVRVRVSDVGRNGAAVVVEDWTLAGQ